MKVILVIITAVILVITPQGVLADCSINGSGTVNVLSSQFPVLEVISKAMRNCERSDLDITYDFLPRKHSEADEALALAFSEGTVFDLIQVANGSFTAPQAAGQLLVLNDLVDKYKTQYNIEDATLIKIGEDVQKNLERVCTIYSCCERGQGHHEEIWILT